MALKYTTTEAIALRLQTRLQIGGSPSSFGNSVVDTTLLDQIGVQVESRVDAKLRQRYVLPLTYTHPQLASIVEKLVICEIIGVHFVGAEVSDDANFGRLMCAQGAKELEAIASGDVALQGETPVAAIPSAPPGYSAVMTRNVARKDAAEKVEW